MRRREFMALVGGAVVSPLNVEAQQAAKVARIGYLAANLAAPRRYHEAFRQGLRSGLMSSQPHPQSPPRPPSKQPDQSLLSLLLLAIRLQADSSPAWLDRATILRGCLALAPS